MKYAVRLTKIAFARACRLLSDKQFLRLKYFLVFGKRLNFSNPQTFNEKLQWLKLYDRNPEYTIMVDKIEAKNWVANRIGKQYIIPTLGVWDRVEDIDFDSLPDQFVLKTNHDSGAVIICKDKTQFDIDNAKRILRKSLRRNYYYIGREWPYKNVKRRILAEELLTPKHNLIHGNIPDYKFLCFNGRVECSFVATERNTTDGLKVTFYDRNWSQMPFTRHYPSSKTPIAKPLQYDKMIELAERLSQGLKFIRVDFYELDGKIYFGEMTFYPGNGYEEFNPEEWDYQLGKLIAIH